MSEHSKSPTSAGMLQQKRRIRAVVACSHCRSKRSKCDGVPGQQACSQCQQRGIECEMSDGKRNRGHYKPQAEALMKQVRALEQALAESRAANEELLSKQQHQQHQHQPHRQEPQPGHFDSRWAHQHMHLEETPSLLALTDLDIDHSVLPSAESIAPSTMPPPPQAFVTAQHQMLGRHPLHHYHDVNSAVSLSGRPSTDTAVVPQSDPARVSDDLDLSPPLADYLLGLFFHRYQQMMKFVSQREAMATYQRDRAGSLRTALFLAMLAGGLRYSTRRDVTDRFLRQADGENVLATAARHAVETELSRPTLATVQTVMILGEVETSLGNQMTGYMYSCLVSRLIFELGFDLGSCTNKSLTQEETTIRHWLVWSASVQDQYWAIFLRRPVTIKNQTLQLSRLAWRFAEGLGGSIGSSDGPHGERTPTLSFENEVDEEILDLMELAREITDALYGQGQLIDRNAVVTSVTSASSSPFGDSGGGGGIPRHYPYPSSGQYHAPDLAGLDARLDHWYDNLSERIRAGPISGGRDFYHYLFVLHMHYNATKIIIHRSRAGLPPTTTPQPRSDTGSGSNSSAPSTSLAGTHPMQSSFTANPRRNVGTGVDLPPATASMKLLGHHSICIAKLFETFRRREDIRTLQCTGVQWAKLAAEALVWYIETLPIDGAIEAIAHLQSLHRTLKDMTRTFKPAEDGYVATTNALTMFVGRMNGAESPQLGPTLHLAVEEQPHEEHQHLQTQGQMAITYDMEPPPPQRLHLHGSSETASLASTQDQTHSIFSTSLAAVATATTASAPLDVETNGVSEAGLAKASTRNHHVSSRAHLPTTTAAVLPSSSWSEHWDWEELMRR